LRSAFVVQRHGAVLNAVVRAAGAGLAVALSVLLLFAPDSSSPLLSAVELVAVIAVGVLALAAVVAFVTARLAGWEEGPEQFERTVRRSERLAREGLAAEPTEREFMLLDPLRDEDFEELVRDALDDLPDLLQNALEHVAVVISDEGRRMHAYGLYQSNSASGGRIVIFRDTLRRDFGDDGDELREQVVRVVRHELAHHVGFDEMGVGELGL
jgi:predicted Zn-dependent protease with MMP-like domain